MQAQILSDRLSAAAEPLVGTRLVLGNVEGFDEADGKAGTVLESYVMAEDWQVILTVKTEDGETCEAYLYEVDWEATEALDDAA